LNHCLKTKSCANFTNGVFGIFFPQKLPYYEEKQSEFAKNNKKNKEFVGKELLIVEVRK
jgi:hypothetical protein